MIEIENLVLFSRTLSENVFGPLYDGPDVGLLVEFEGGLVCDALSGEIFDGEPTPGIIAGLSDNGIVISVNQGYVGSVTPGRFRILNFVSGDPSKIH